MGVTFLTNEDKESLEKRFDNVYTKQEIDDKGYLTEHQNISGKANIDLSNVTNTDFKTKAEESGIGCATTPTYTFCNLLNPNDENYEAGKYVNPTTGKTANHENYNTSGYIEVSPGDIIVASRSISHVYGKTWRDGHPLAWYAYYDKNKTVVKGDGRVYGEKMYHFIPDNVRYIRVSIEVFIPEVMVEKLACSGISDEYLEYGDEKTVVSPAVDNKDGMFLPPYIYATKGRPFDIYTAAMFGDTQVLNNIERIGYTASGFGKTEISNRRFRFNPTGGGRLELYLKAKNAEGISVLSAMSRVIVKDGSTATKRIVTIGDSLTAGKPWIAELMRLNPNYEFVGTFMSTAKDTTGTERTFNHDGRSGWRAEQYYTGYAPTSNNFWDSENGKFSFSYYVTNTLGGIAPDVVIVFLGMNDMERDIDAAIGYEKNIIDNIRSSYPSMPIIVCAPQARDYNVEGHVAKNGFLMMKKLYEAFALYQNLYFVPLYLIHDSEYNYQLVDEQEGVNIYSSVTQNKVVDSVHPQDAGYFQFADAIYGALSAIG